MILPENFFVVATNKQLPKLKIQISVFLHQLSQFIAAKDLRLLERMQIPMMRQHWVSPARFRLTAASS